MGSLDSSSMLLCCTLLAVQVLGVFSQQAAFFSGTSVSNVSAPVTNGGNFDVSAFTRPILACKLVPLPASNPPANIISVYKNGMLLTASSGRVSLPHFDNRRILVAFTNITEADGGAYSCHVGGVMTAQITVRVKPYIVLTPPVYTLVDEQLTNLTCDIYGYPTPVRTWDTITSNIRTLTLRGAGALMIPYFNCTASNAAGFTWSIARVLYLQTLKPAETYPANIGIFSDVVNIIPCRATGGPNLRYSWSTVTLSGSTTPVNPANVLTNNSLLLPVNRNRVSMTYRCTVRSLLPWDMTRDAQAPLHIDRTVTILILPTFIVSPRDITQTFTQYNPFSVSCTATGSPLPVITMLRNGEVIQAETSGARTVSLASYDPSSSQRVLTLSIERGIGRRAELDSGIYQCLANSSIGSGHSAKGVVILSVSVRFLGQPRSQVIHAGSTLSLSCNATSYPPSRYQWFRNNTLIPGATGMFLYVQDTQVSDSGDYHCLAQPTVPITNALFGTAVKSNTASVAVLIPARVLSVEALPSSAIRVGLPVNITCKVAGHPPPSIFFSKDGSPIGNSSSYRLYKSSAFTLTLAIPSAGQGQHGVYYCNTTNSEGTNQKSISISVPRPPFFVAQLPAQSVGVIGRRFQLVCNVSGQPAPNVAWTIPTGSGAIQQGHGIVIPMVRETDAGIYTCRASSSLNTIMGSSTLGIQDGAAIVSELSNVSVEIGGQLNVVCRISGRPTPIVTWRHRGLVVTSSARVSINSSTVTGLMTSQLRISSLTLGDYGSFSCSVANQWGTATSAASIFRLEAPPMPVIPVASNRTAGSSSTNIFLTWDSGQAIFTTRVAFYRIRYTPRGTSGSPAFAKTPLTQLELSGLLPGTTYSWEVRAENGAGSSAYTSPQLFTTSSLPVAETKESIPFYMELWFYCAVGGAVLLLIIIFIVLCCICCRGTKSSDLDIFDPDAPPPPGGTPGYAHTQPSTATRAEYLQMSGTEPNNTPWHTDKSGQGDDQYYDMYEGVEKADKLYQDAFQPPNWPNKLERGSQQSHLSSANSIQ